MKSLHPQAIRTIFTLLLVTPYTFADEADQQHDDQFVRLRKADDGKPIALETAIASYTSKENADLEVDLIGAIHVGDGQYYDLLNKRFAEYDAVLYELVAPPNAVPEPGQRSAHPVSALQMGMKTLLGLEFQLDRVDYKRENLVHADLSPEEFAESMADRGESFLQMFFRLMGQSMAMQAKNPVASNDVQFLAALISPDRHLKLKQILAREFEDMTATTTALDGPDGSTIITVRNKRAVDVLEAQIKKGKKRLGIFYGAAHLPDMQRQLADQLGLTHSKREWIQAWDLQSTRKKSRD